MRTLKSALALFVVILLASCQPKSQTPQKIDKNIGLQLYSLRDDIKSFDSTVDTVGKMGYKYIEAASYNDGKFYGMSPEEFKSKLDKAGLIALSSHTNYRLPDDPSTAKWDEIWTWWDTAIAAHKATGMKYIVAPSMPTPKTLKDLQIYCDYYNQIGEKCKAAGMKFGYHNHSFEFEKIEDKVMYEYMVENTNPDLVFFQMDVYWVVMGRFAPVDLFEKYPGRFEILHIKDRKELGQSGMVGFDAIFNNIDKSGAKYLIVEVERYSKGFTPVGSVKASLDYLLEAPFVKADYSVAAK